MDIKDLAVAIEAARIDIKRLDKEIFETQQEIKIKTIEQCKNKDDSQDSTGIMVEETNDLD